MNTHDTIRAGGAERAALADLHLAAPSDLRERLGLEVREIGTEHGEDFGRIAAAGFELDDAWIPVLAGPVERDGWHVYLSFDGGQPAGGGAMRIHEGMAWLDWAATLPEFRRRGSQGVIISRRISDGISLGCSSFATSTGEEVSGDAQHSYHNIECYGFRRTHARANWVQARTV